MAAPSPARVFLVDDHQIVREGLHALLLGEPDLVIVGEATDGNAALSGCAALCPDVVLLDVGMPGLDGIETTRRLSREQPGVRVIILSMHDHPALVHQALSAGARGYVEKGRGIDHLIAAVRAVHRGEVYLSPGVQADWPGCDRAPGGQDLDALSAREREVLALLAEGHSGPQIARRLGLAGKTIENHRARIMDKLDIHTTAGLVRYALQVGISR